VSKIIKRTAKNLRFAEIVKKSGRPETVTLWTKPEANAELQDAIRQNRVLTIFKNAHKKDFGLIGFEQHPSALYLVFPKSLPKSQPDAQVIGINYELLGKSASAKDLTFPQPTAKKNFKAPPKTIAPSSHVEKPPKSQSKIFLVTVTRAASLETQVQVTAINMTDAEAQALEKVKRQKISPENVRNEVTAVTESK
jgi:hypothetical protein